MLLGDRGNYVIHNKKFVFMMLKKCGSVTMGKVILESLGYKDLSGPNVNRVLGSLRLNRYEVAALDYTKVVWVRNPFDRLVSGWFHRVHNVTMKEARDSYGIPNTISFPDFVEWVCSIKDKEMNAHFRQQTFDITIDGVLVPNVIIKLENLKEDWQLLKARFDWLVDIKYHEHRTNKGNYCDYYKKDMIDKVKIRFVDDFRLLEYEEFV